MSFSGLVQEAFISPLRSVLIMDDQYPTWEEVLGGGISVADSTENPLAPSAEKNWKNDPSVPLNVISQFRSQNTGLIIDIDDGVGVSDAIVTGRLHQSDLLVLDYNLEGAESGLGGEKARMVLQSVLSSKHFNLIVVHTGEPDIDDVMFKSLLAMMSSFTSQFDERLNNELCELDQKIDSLRDEEKFDENLLRENLGPTNYLELRDPKSDQAALLRLFMRSEGVLGGISDWGRELGLKGRDLRNFFYWSIREYEKSIEGLFANETSHGLIWGDENGCRWMRTGKGFVTFVKKGSNDLLLELQKAIENWRPTPSRLLSAKYRHEYSKIGVEAEDRTLSKSHVFAHFYKDLCSPVNSTLSEEEGERLCRAKLKAQVARQSESISFHIQDEVVSFGEKIKNIDERTSGNFASHYNVDLANDETSESRKAVRHYNSYVSTLPLKDEDDQLDSGHIFQIANEWWVCATPACDLQPGQNTIACLLYTSPSPRDRTRSRMPSSA